jgi:hypothetical protein
MKLENPSILQRHAAFDVTGNAPVFSPSGDRLYLPGKKESLT